MKAMIPVFLLFLLALALPASSQSAVSGWGVTSVQPPGGQEEANEAVGTLPRSSSPFGVSGSDSTGTGSTTEPENRSQKSAGNKHKVSAGECFSNSDGVELCNNEDSSGAAWIDPEEGTNASHTEVTSLSGFEGTVNGLDGNDVVDLGSSNDVDISGTGGTVNAQGGSTLKVTNNGGVGATMTINLNNGSTIQVSGGSSVTINT